MDKEIGRKYEIAKTLDYLSRQLGQLDVVNDLPHDFDRRDVVINCAMDVRSAAMLYLASQINHDITPFGTVGMTLDIVPILLYWLPIIGKLAKIFFTGDGSITDSTAYLKFSIDSYNNALGNINLQIVIKVYDLLKGTQWQHVYMTNVSRHSGLEKPR